MAFCVKSDKKFSQVTGIPEVGPGSYENLQEQNMGKANKKRQNNAPFNLSDLRDNDKQQLTTPGPGEYQLKLVQKQQIDINQKPLQSSIFSSNIDRFNLKNKGYPDPGEYFPHFEEKKNKIIEDQKILEQIKRKQIQKQNNCHRAIPNKRVLTADVQIKMQQNQLLNSKQQNQKSMKARKQLKGTSWSKYKEKKYCDHIKNETNQQIGPGKYSQDQENNKIFQRKAQSQFMSTTQRKFQFQSGLQANQFILQKLKNEAIQLAVSEQEINQIEQIQINKSEYITREHQNPGPGYYHDDNYLEKQSQKKDIQWNRDQRFSPIRSYSTCGPQEYQKTKFNNGYQTQQGTFTYEEKMKETINKNPGPGNYNQNQNISYIAQKYKDDHDYKNKKISTAIKIENNEETLGPGHYHNMDFSVLNAELDLISGKSTYQFISKTDKKHFIENKDQLPPGTYNHQYQTIQGELLNKKLGLKHVPYSRSVLQQKPIEIVEEEICEKEDIIHKKEKKKKQQKKSYLPNEIRFQQQHKNSTKLIGPGQYYDFKKQPFNKISYNTHFADI